MKHMKKLIAVLLTAAMALSLAACGSSDSGSSSSAADDGTDSSSSATSEAGTTAASDEGMKIAIVSTSAGVDDGSFIQNCYEGILSFIDSRGGIDTVTDIMEPTGDPAAAVQAVADIVADYDVIVTPGFQFAGIGTLAQENPDTKFILVDSYATDADGN
ncbi:BMP family ABC transporter substrate-binding protein, partial [uncultured Subdoligranulum sp.]|uniref:BMP family ABC transporter substrate-binding protein n=1 Tax=uncultured Subdoligranulum sp. TaxID=512298 RepID=UPI0025FFC89D